MIIMMSADDVRLGKFFQICEFGVSKMSSRQYDQSLPIYCAKMPVFTAIDMAKSLHIGVARANIIETVINGDTPS